MRLRASAQIEDSITTSTAMISASVAAPQQTNAQAALSTLTPAAARDDAIAFDLRYASRLMTEAMTKSAASERL
jgi:hypothetical protein